MQIIILMLIIAAAAIIALWILPFTWPVAAAGTALFVIISSFVFLGLANWAYKKYIKNNPKFLKKFKL